MEIVLFQPEIPPNTGNIARLCAATGTKLHLIKPLGFSLEDRYLKRAGLDYWQYVNMQVWDNLSDYLEQAKDRRLIATSAKGGSPLHKMDFYAHDSLVFGPETRGLPPEVLDICPNRVWIPQKNTVRSLNLSTCAGIILYQALISSGEINMFGPEGLHT